MRNSIFLTRTVSVIMLLVALQYGCASAPPSSLQQMKLAMVTKLAAQCYWEHDGERYVFGAGPVWLACRTWAKDAVNGHFANTSGNQRDRE
jgi:hypothetical protein